MLIGVDAGCLGIKDKRLKVGVYQIAKNLLENLGKNDRENKYLLYSFYPIDKALMQSFGKSMRNIVVKPTKGWRSIWLPLRIDKDKPDVYLGLSQALPRKTLFSHRPYMIDLVYDLAFEKFPDMYPGASGKLSKVSKEAIRNSDSILTVSKSSKKDISKLYKVRKNKIKVIYPGTPEGFDFKGKKYKAQKPFFLYVGSLKRTKNIPSIIKAFTYFRQKSGKDYQLYLVGGDMWLDESLKELSLGKDIKFLGFVTQNHLARMYRSAVAFVSPSFYEGFGLTHLQALKSGCPVIASNAGSIPEIVGKAAILVRPTDYKALGEAMIKIDKYPKMRERYINKGLKRAKAFSWDIFSKEILEEIEMGGRKKLKHL